MLIFLKDITAVTRTDLKAYCFELVTKDRSYFLSCKNDEELYSWMHEIYSRSPLMGVSKPTNFVHQVHVGFDPNTGNFTVRSPCLRVNQIVRNFLTIAFALTFY